MSRLNPLSYEELLARDGYFVGPPVGVSMNPLLRMGRDVMVIRPCERPHFLDVVLFRRDDGTYVLHRIVGRTAKGYTLRGDNQFFNEYGVRQEQILGRMSDFCRNGKTISCKRPSVVLYGFLRWVYCSAGVLLVRVKRRMIRFRS